MRTAKSPSARAALAGAAKSNIPDEAESAKIPVLGWKEGDYCLLVFLLCSFVQFGLPDPVVVAFCLGGKRDSSRFVICLSVGRRTVTLNIISAPARH